jgi:hypothetical protein
LFTERLQGYDGVVHAPSSLRTDEGRLIFPGGTKLVLGKGQEVHFAADTPIEVQLAPGPTPR